MPILLELRQGIGEPEQVPLSTGKQLSVGRRGMWRIEGPKVLDIHGHFYYDGMVLFVMSESDRNPVLVNRAEVPTDWTSVKAPAEISMGGVQISFVGSIGQEDSGVTLARVPPPSRQAMEDLDNAPTSHGGGKTIPRGDANASPAVAPRVPSAAPSRPAIKPTGNKPRPSVPSKPEYVEPPARDLDGTSGVTHVRPDTLERLAADHKEAIAAAAHGPQASHVPTPAPSKAKPPQPSPLPARPPSGGFTMVLPEGNPPAPAPRPITAPPQAQAPTAGRKEGSGATRFAPLEAPSGASLEANAMQMSGASQAARAPQPSGALFSSGPPALYAHQTAPPFAPTGANASAPWPNVAPPPAAPAAKPAPGTQDATVQKLTVGARLRRDWAATSWPKKALLFLAPALAYVLLSDDPEDLIPGKAATKPTATASATSTAASSAPPSATGVSAPSAASTAAIIPAPMTTSTAKVQPPPAVPPGGTAKPPSSLERKAIDALSMGQEADALRYYDELAKEQPENPNFKEAARILRKRHDPGPPK